MYLKEIAAILCPIILVLGLIGNALVLLVIIRTKELRNSTSYFLINLSLADFLVLAICMPTILIELHSKPEVWILGETLCKAIAFLELAVAHGSVLTILAISFERYYAICRPLEASFKCTRLRAALIITLIWFFSLLITIPMLYITQFAETEYIDGSFVSVCLTQANTVSAQIYFSFIIAAFFGLPMLILVIIYREIVRHLSSSRDCSSYTATDHQHHGQVSLACNCDQQPTQLRQGDHNDDHNGNNRGRSSIFTISTRLTRWSRSMANQSDPFGSSAAKKMSTASVSECHQMALRRQVIAILIGVVLLFFLCLLPFRLLLLWILFASDEQMKQLGMELYYNLLYSCRILLYSHSAVNPLLYNLISSRFRHAFAQLFAWFCFRRKQSRNRHQTVRVNNTIEINNKTTTKLDKCRSTAAAAAAATNRTTSITSFNSKRYQNRFRSVSRHRLSSTSSSSTTSSSSATATTAAANQFAMNSIALRNSISNRHSDPGSAESQI